MTGVVVGGEDGDMPAEREGVQKAPGCVEPLGLLRVEPHDANERRNSRQGHHLPDFVRDGGEVNPQECKGGCFASAFQPTGEPVAPWGLCGRSGLLLRIVAHLRRTECEAMADAVQLNDAVLLWKDLEDRVSLLPADGDKDAALLVDAFKNLRVLRAAPEG